MTPVQILVGTAALCTIITALWLALRFLFAPHLKATITAAVAPQLKSFEYALVRHGHEIPELTAAVRELTTATNRQSADTERLSETMTGLNGRVDALSREFGSLAERTARIEGAILPVDAPVAKIRRARTK